MCEEDRFEKTANELEEVLKRKFPDVSPPKTSTLKSQPALKPTTNSTAPILTPSHTIKQEVKEEPGKFNYIIKLSKNEIVYYDQNMYKCNQLFYFH